MDTSAAFTAVGTALGTKRIGVPVFVRVVDHTTARVDAVEPRLGRALDEAAGWIGAGVRRLAALGDFAPGQVSVLVEFDEGQTALVSVGTRGEGPPLLEIVVVGNRGVLSWEPEPGPHFGAESASTPLSQTARQLLDAVRRSLQSGNPVAMGGNAASGDVRVERVAGAERSEPPVQRVSREGDSPIFAARKSGQSSPYGVLLVAGAHTHQENYAEDFAADPRCRLIGLADEAGVSKRRKALNERLAHKLGIPLLADLDQALARDDVHVVSVCAEPERRAGVMIRCARADDRHG
jgi:hypothetical protein